MRRIFLPLLLLAVVVGCDKKSPSEPDDPDPDPADTRLLITGSDMGTKFQNLYVNRGTAPVTTAEVRVNGVLLAHQGNGFYQGQLPGFLNPGEQITLEVKDGSDTVTGVANIAAVPVMTAPVSGGTLTRTTPLAFAWTSTSNPSEFVMGISYFANGGGTGLTQFVSGSTRSGSVVTTTIPAGATQPTAYVFAYSNGTFTGPANPNSKMRVRQPSAEVSLVLQ